MKWLGPTLCGVLASFPLGCASSGRVGSGGTDGAATDGAVVAGDADSARAKRIVEAALDGRAHAMLRELTTVAPARLSGSANAARAVEWGLATMRAIGLDNVRAEPVMVPHWTRGEPESCERLGDDGKSAEEYRILALGGSEPTPEDGIAAEVMMVRSFEELQQRAAEARGRIVFFNRPMPRILANTFRAYGQAVPQRANGAIEAAKAGGVFALVRSMTTRIDEHPHTGMMMYDAAVPHVPSAAICTLDADALAARLERGEHVSLRIRMHCATGPDVPSANVVGEIVGRERPDELIVVGGHLDSWDVGQGAQDDGAGICHTLEAARLLRQLGERPRRTIRFVLFMNEENGLRGGNGYRDAHAGEHHVAAIESDAGGDMALGFGTSAKGARFEFLRKALAALEPYGMGALTAGGGGADIGPLAASGCEMFGLSVISARYFDYHHSVLDTADSVNERALAFGAGAIAYLAGLLADADLPPND